MKSIYLENSVDGVGETQRGEKCVLAFTWKECVLGEGAGQPDYSLVFPSGTIFTLSAPDDLPDFPFLACRISTYDRP